MHVQNKNLFELCQEEIKTKEVSETEGIYFKGKFLSYDLINEIKSKY